MALSLVVRLNTGTCPHLMRLALTKSRKLLTTSQLCLASHQGSAVYDGPSPSTRFFSIASSQRNQESKGKEVSTGNVADVKDVETSQDNENIQIRESYIPITRQSIIRHLIEDKDLMTDNERKIFPNFSRALDRAIMNQYQGVLGELKTLFDPINPDKDTIQTRAFSRGEKLDNEFWLLQQLDDIMEKANFHELPKSTVHKYLKEHLSGGIQVSVDLNRYDVLRFWVLGHERPEVSLTLMERLTNKVLKRPPRQAIEYYKRVIVAIRLKRDSKLILKAFKEVPIHNLQMLLPDGTVQMTKLDKGVMITSLAIAGLGILAKVVTHMAQLNVDWTLLVTSITGLIGFRAWTMYKHRRNEYLVKVMKLLYYKNIANNRSLLAVLVDRAEDESFKEALLTYTFLMTSRPTAYRCKSASGIPPEHLGGLTTEELAEQVENWLENKTGVKINFNASEAVVILTNLGIISMKDDKLHSVMLDTASHMLPSVRQQAMVPKDEHVVDGFDRDMFLETEEEYKENDERWSKYGWH